jgi:hypothetical protein
MDRSLLQVEQRRSNPADGYCIVRSLAKTAAQTSRCDALPRRAPGCVRPWRAGMVAPCAGYVGRGSCARGRCALVPATGSDPVAGPTRLIRPNCRMGMAGDLRDRLHRRPLAIRATSNNEPRRSFNR